MSASTEKKLRQAAREAGTDKKLLAQQREAELKAKNRRRWTWSGIGVALLVAVTLFLNSGFLYKNTSALAIGDENYSPAQVSYQYASQYYDLANQYGDYAMLLGLDTSAGFSGLDEQDCTMMEEGSWRDYFLDAAKTSLTQIKAVKDYADANGIALDETEQAALAEEQQAIEDFAKTQGYSNADKFFAANYGSGVDSKLAIEATEASLVASKALLGYSEALEYSDKELEEKYAGYNGEQDYYDYVYYYVMAETVEGEDGNFAATDETKAAAKAKAEAIAEAYEAAEEENVEARLNAAISENGIDAKCTHSINTGAALGVYKDWVMSIPESGDVTVVADSTQTNYYVVAFIGHNDNDYDLVNVRHILVKAAADENGEYTDEAKAEALARAEELYEQWKSGEATEESFAAMANEFSEDGGSNTNGGLYENVMQGQMVEEFDRFCFERHKSGDTGIVYGEAEGSYAGYHIMYFVSQGENARDYIARTDLSKADTQAWLDELVSGYEPAEKYWIKLVG